MFVGWVGYVHVGHSHDFMMHGILVLYTASIHRNASSYTHPIHTRAHANIHTHTGLSVTGVSSGITPPPPPSPPPPSPNPIPDESGLSTGAIVGIAIAGVTGLVLCMQWMCVCVYAVCTPNAACPLPTHTTPPPHTQSSRCSAVHTAAAPSPLPAAVKPKRKKRKRNVLLHSENSLKRNRNNKYDRMHKRKHWHIKKACLKRKNQ